MEMSFLQGFGTGGGLIIAIGAQNAFVLSQGIRKNHPLIIALICIFCDATLIAVGTAGVGSLISKNPVLIKFATGGGALFLLYYGFMSLKSAFKPKSLEAADTIEYSLKSVILTTLAVTLLNPHLYLDTVVLIGSISSSFPADERLLFTIGAITASIIWFLSLSYGARVLSPLFKKPIAWRVLDSMICLVMWGIAISLVNSNLT